MTEAEQEKIADYRKRREDILRILDDIVEIIRFQDRPEDAILEQKLEEIRKIFTIYLITASCDFRHTFLFHPCCVYIHKTQRILPR